MRPARVLPASLLRRLAGRALLTAVLLTAAAHVWAEVAYVTDQGEFNLRRGESTRHKIIRMLASGTPVEVLSQDKENGYSKIELDNGTQGYILTRYLQQEPAARTQLADALDKLEELQQEPDQLAAQLTRLQEEHAALKLNYDQVFSRKTELEQALAELEQTAANVVRINQERNQLQQDVAKLTRTVGELEQENLALRSGDDRRWFLAGAGVAGGGLVLGLLLPNLGFKRRRGSSRDLF